MPRSQNCDMCEAQMNGGYIGSEQAESGCSMSQIPSLQRCSRWCGRSISIHMAAFLVERNIAKLTLSGTKPACFLMKIVEIIPKDNYTLYIRSDDGQIGLFDVNPYLESEAFAPLKDDGEFEKIHNGRYFIEWDCGADLSADTIQSRWVASDSVYPGPNSTMAKEPAVDDGVMRYRQN